MNEEFNILHFSKIKKSWKKRVVLNQVELEIHAGNCTLITGKNGSGKSTLLKIMAGLLKPDDGSLNIGRKTFCWPQAKKVIRQHIMYLHQTPYLFDGSVEKNLTFVNSALNIEEAMIWANIHHLAKRQTHSLSGGERQRVALARAWLKQPQVLLLDEPTANLDDDSKQRTLKLINDFKRKGAAIVIVSHEPKHFKTVLNKKMHLKNGALLAYQEN